MYNKIIVALSLEHGISDKAIMAARQLANEGAEIIALHVHEPARGSVKAYLSEEDVIKAMKASEAALKDRVKDQDGVKPVMLRGIPGRDIPEYAKEIGADCIVAASHLPGLQDFFLGSTASRIVRHAECSVHVLR
jgi:nucleotide-binding universal stress UspA family protein